MYATSYRGTAESNKVLRNTFGLLAVSLIPTIFGSLLGFAIGIPALMAGSPLISSLVFLAVTFGLLFVINANRDSGVGVVSMLGFTFLMGMWLSGILNSVLGLANGQNIIAMAGLGTIAVTGGCSIYAMTTKRDFSGIGGFLIGSLIALIVISLANIFFQLPLLSLLISIVAVVLFSAFMVFDVQRVVNGGETNYVMAATSIYLNIYNIFTALLNIFGFLSGDD